MHGRSGARRCCGLTAAAVTALAVLQPAAGYQPLTNYRLDCMGCHLASGAGAPGKVPDMRTDLVRFALSAAGRRYLVAVPGAADSPLTDRQLAELLNWMIGHLSAVPRPRALQAYTPAEVAADRGSPLVQPSGIRARLLAAAGRPAARH